MPARAPVAGRLDWFITAVQLKSKLFGEYYHDEKFNQQLLQTASVM
jgi:hypothetical protein